MPFIGSEVYNVYYTVYGRTEPSPRGRKKIQYDVEYK